MQIPPNAGAISLCQNVNGKLFSITNSWLSVSDDVGETWTETANPFGTTYIRNIVWNGSKYCVIDLDYPYALWSSSDGIAWTSVNLYTLDPNYHASALVAVGADFILAGKYGITLTSTDAINWSVLGLRSNNGEFYPIPATGAGFACRTYTGGVYGIAVTSSPTSAWSAPASLPSGSVYIAAGNGYHVVRIGTGIQYSSDNGANWTPSTFPASTYGAKSLFYGDSKWVSGGEGFGLIRVANTSFVLTGSPSSGFSYTYNNSVSVVYDGIRWIALSSFGEIATSTDAATWTLRTNPGYVGGTLVTGGGVTLTRPGSNLSLDYARTTDGVTWTAYSIPNTPSEHSLKLSYAGGLFVASCYSSTRIWTSSDGISWTEKQFLKSYADVSYASGYWQLPGAVFTQDFDSFAASQYIINDADAMGLVTSSRVVYVSERGAQTSNKATPYLWEIAEINALPTSVSYDPNYGAAVIGDVVLVSCLDGDGRVAVVVTADGVTWSAPTALDLVNPGTQLYLHASGGIFYALTTYDNSFGYGSDFEARLYSSSTGADWDLVQTSLGHSSFFVVAADTGCFYLHDSTGLFTLCGGVPPCVPFWTNHSGQYEICV